jgi:hypothetical protein
MSRLSEIYEGWKNYIFPNPEIEKEAKRRIAICIETNCKEMQPNNTCSLCGCYMPAKVRSPKSKCKLKKW